MIKEEGGYVKGGEDVCACVGVCGGGGGGGEGCVCVCVCVCTGAAVLVEGALDDAEGHVAEVREASGVWREEVELYVYVCVCVYFFGGSVNMVIMVVCRDILYGRAESVDEDS
jgi:hypothetical protein